MALAQSGIDTLMKCEQQEMILISVALTRGRINTHKVQTADNKLFWISVALALARTRNNTLTVDVQQMLRTWMGLLPMVQKRTVLRKGYLRQGVPPSDKKGFWLDTGLMGFNTVQGRIKGSVFRGHTSKTDNNQAIDEECLKIESEIDT
ncbi:hypothetical protein EDD22DRAFT_847644 [Suillus occidentalis]|nr:hypothetical protein EDD22DRAFT_847644 [Suillus occidentalis]